MMGIAVVREEAFVGLEENACYQHFFLLFFFTIFLSSFLLLEVKPFPNDKF